MGIRRRRIVLAAAFAGAAGPAAAQNTALGPVAAVHGVPLSEERLRLLAPVLARRRAQWEALRSFPLDDRTGLVPGVLDGGD